MSRQQGTAGTLTGTVLYRERIALPPTASVSVKLVDVSLADTAAPSLGEFRKQPAGQVPIAFSISFNAALIQPNHTYALSVRIEDQGQLLFINAARVAVLTGGNPKDKVTVLLQKAVPGLAPGVTLVPPAAGAFGERRVAGVQVAGAVVSRYFAYFIGPELTWIEEEIIRGVNRAHNRYNYDAGSLVYARSVQERNEGSTRGQIQLRVHFDRTNLQVIDSSYSVNGRARSVPRAEIEALRKQGISLAAEAKRRL